MSLDNKLQQGIAGLTKQWNDFVYNAIREREDAWLNEKRLLLRQIDDLKGFASVSMVKNLSKQITELKIQNRILKKKLENMPSQQSRSQSRAQSPLAARVPPSSPVPPAAIPVVEQPKLKPKIVMKMKEQELQHQEHQRESQEKQELQQQEEEEQPQNKEQQEQQEQELEKQELEKEEQEQELQQDDEEEQEQEQELQQDDEEEQEQQEQQEFQQDDEEEQQEQEDDEDEEEELELIVIDLESGSYLLDHQSLDLYDVPENDEDLGEPVGKLRLVSIKNQKHLIDPLGNHIYTYIEADEGFEIGECVGTFRNGRAKFFKK